MAYVFAPSVGKFIGYESTDKPVLTGPAAIGAELLEITADGVEFTYIWSGTEWVLDLRLYAAMKAAIEATK